MASRAAGTYPPVPEPLPHPIVDTHTHLDIGTGVRLPLGAGEPSPDVTPSEDEEFPDLDFFFDTAEAAGVRRIVQIGCDLPAARWTTALVASQYAGQGNAALAAAANVDPAVAARVPTPPVTGRTWMLGGAALHPNEAPRLAERGLLDDALTEIETLVTSEDRMRVVGETGLDYFRTGEDGIAEQQRSFRAHIEIAKRTGRALQIHDREAHADVLRILREEGAPEVTIFHCFSGDEAMARECAEHGYFMSFAGNITFKNADELRRAAASAPLELLLTETDAPFLTPHPYRGKPGGPYLTPITARMLAEVRGMDAGDLAEAVWANAETALGSWD
ncbi:TatD family hydrolase [Brevibacterium casei]|uniref:TatD DNase family protein n=1 Tax=Brevibacterium casei CIP 102111 TaxID=1255625 RepID=A0A2H1JZS5_9MICO|nr:TatD family hydrolase [Brevibacterium casei]QPR38185.1 TatD family hydrolase [Brevibacterium casei]QPR45474.1 TatD family hydrolase [Brevibacterium casei]SMX92794.1 TatD DNase family protein [Brevibacterium casei CIP 102111]